MFDRFIRVMLSADMGADGGSSMADAGGADAGAAVDAGAEVAEGGGDESAALLEFAKANGGLQNLQEAWSRDQAMKQRVQHNPQFAQWLQRAWNGDYGPAEQQKAQQVVQQQQGQQVPQQGQGPAYLKYEPQQVALMGDFHRQLMRAQQEGPEAVQALYNDPRNADAAKAYREHQKAMNDSWWDQRGHFTKLYNDPEMQAMRQREMQEAVRQQLLPTVTRYEHREWSSWYQQNKARADQLPQHLKDAIANGVFGPVGQVHEGGTAQMWIDATEAALREFQKMQQPPGQQNGNVARTPAPAGQRPPPREAKNGVTRPQPTIGDAVEQYAREQAAARRKETS